VLVEALHSTGCARFVAGHDLRAGNIAEHLDVLLEEPHRWRDQPINGARVVAETLLDRLKNG
jgi:hypothetical protein